jgi:hypothetical protein
MLTKISPNFINFITIFFEQVFGVIVYQNFIFQKCCLGNTNTVVVVVFFKFCNTLLEFFNDWFLYQRNLCFLFQIQNILNRMILDRMFISCINLRIYTGDLIIVSYVMLEQINLYNLFDCSKIKHLALNWDIRSKVFIYDIEIFLNCGFFIRFTTMENLIFLLSYENRSSHQMKLG